MSTYPGALLWLKIGTRLWVPVKISWGEVQAMEVGGVGLMAWRDGETNWKRKDQVKGANTRHAKGVRIPVTASARIGWAID